MTECHYYNKWFDWSDLDDYIWSELRKNGVCTQKRNSRWTEPRLTAWFSEDDIVYEYSGIRHESQGWPRWVEHLAQGIKRQYGDRYHKPNSVLVNVYRNGKDYVSMHKDDEPLFDNNQPIASVSLGATRAFAIGISRTTVDHTIDLEGKSLLLMLPGFQDKYWHGVPRQPDVEYARVNLTFRYVKPQEKPEGVNSEVSADPAPTDTSGELDPKFKEWLESTGRIGKYLNGPGYRKDHMKRVYKLILEKNSK